MKNNFPSNNKPIQLFRYEMSGHCHRVQLMMSLLDIPYELVDLNRDGSNQPDGFLNISPMGQVPVIDDNGIQLADSNAILVYLIKKYSTDSAWLPEDPERQARIQRWLSVAAGELMSGPAIARFSKVFNVEIDYKTAKTKANALLTMMNNTLNNNDYLTGEVINISDIALYTYTAHAPEGGIPLEPFPNVISWLTRIESLNGFVAMKSTPLAQS